MIKKEKDLVSDMIDAMNALPEPKREYLIGYIDGANAMATTSKEKEPDPKEVSTL